MLDAMEWTSTKPRSAGYFWYRRDPVDRPVLIEIADEGIVFRFGEADARRVSDLPGEFKGPLYP